MEQSLISVLLKLYAWPGHGMYLPSEAILAYAETTMEIRLLGLGKHDILFFLAKTY